MEVRRVDRPTDRLRRPNRSSILHRTNSAESYHRGKKCLRYVRVGPSAAAPLPPIKFEMVDAVSTCVHTKYVYYR